MRIAKLLTMCALLLMVAGDLRADTAAPQPVAVTLKSASGATLDGSTTLEDFDSTPIASSKYGSTNYARITMSSCTWYRPCLAPTPPPTIPEPITLQSQTPTAQTPEPASLALFGSGLLGIVAVVKRKLRAAGR